MQDNTTKKSAIVAKKSTLNPGFHRLLKTDAQSGPRRDPKVDPKCNSKSRYATDTERSPDALDRRVGKILDAYDGVDAMGLLEGMIKREFPGRIAMMSSFGAEAAILLDMVASIDPSLPVYFFDTGKLFAQTHAYYDTLRRSLKLTDIRIVHPVPDTIAASDPDGTLWQKNGHLCCHIRKVEPWLRVRDQSGMTAWITGRKRFHGASRSRLARVEREDHIIKINPLADWDAHAIAARMGERALPTHPLVAKGYLSIGCEPCTLPAPDGADPRSGRWIGEDKTECGLHDRSGDI